MNKAHTSILYISAIMLLLVASCTQVDELKPLPQVNSPRVIIPKTSGEDVLESSTDSAFSISTPNQTPAVPMDSNVSVYHIYDIELGDDGYEEQVLVIKKNDDPSNRIFLVLLDYDEGRQYYTQSWEGATLATNIRSFQSEFIDIDNDSILEMAVTGTDNNNSQTLEIFKIFNTDNNTRLIMRSVFSQSIKGKLQLKPIGTIEDPEGYTISAEYPNEDTEDDLDLISETYTYNSGQQRFILRERIEIEAPKDQQASMTEIFRGTNERFKEYLKGAWIHEKDAGKIILFDPEEEQIILYQDGNQSIYKWSRSWRQIYKRLVVTTNNSAVNSLTQSMSITALEPDSIEINVAIVFWYRRFDAGLNGNYRRYTVEEQNAFIEAIPKTAEVRKGILQGLYKNETGFELYFSGESVTLREKNQEYKGSFVLFELEGPEPVEIFQMALLNKDGFIQEKKSFIMEWSSQETDIATINRMRLTPANLKVNGAFPSDNYSILLEQRIEKSNN